MGLQPGLQGVAVEAFWGGVERGALTAQPSAFGHDQRAVDIVLAAGQVDDTPARRARRLQSALDGGRRSRTRPAAAALL